MRLLITADLHYNHAKSKALADQLIEQMSDAGGDALLVVGDTGVADGDSIEQCLSRFRFAGEKIFVAGNHELWTQSSDSYAIFHDGLPRRIRQLGWRWLQDDPFVLPNRTVAIVGSVGWYDYSFAVPDAQIPRRFYAAKVSPGAAARLSECAHLLDDQSDISPHAMESVARWNDGKFVKLHRSDDAFLDELLLQLRSQLDAYRACRT